MRKQSFILLPLCRKIDAYQTVIRSDKGGICLTVRERILMIRLMEKLEKHPAYAKPLGIEATDVVNNQNRKNNPNDLGNT